MAILRYELYNKINKNTLQYVGDIEVPQPDPEPIDPVDPGGYSVEPVKIGTWIDDTPIWRVVYPITELSEIDINGTRAYATELKLDATMLISGTLIGKLQDNTSYSTPVSLYQNSGVIAFSSFANLTTEFNTNMLIVEYVKA